jgi:hypothetical protein
MLSCDFEWSCVVWVWGKWRASTLQFTTTTLQVV